MQKLRIKEKGITLIALVVTIIVLLILASIAINLTIGNNGLFIRARMAAEKSKEETAKEEVKIAWAAITTDYVFDASVKQDVKKEDYYTKENLNKELKDTGEITNFEYDPDGTTTLTYVKPNKENIKEEYDMEIEDKDTIEVKILEKIPLPEGALEFSELTWENKKASLNITTSSEFEIQYQINEKLKDGWVSGTQVSDLNIDDIVYARLVDGKRVVANKMKKVTDNIKPNIVLNKKKVGKNGFTIYVEKVEDLESGIPEEPMFKFEIREDTNEEFTEVQNNTYTECVFTGLNQGTKYVVKVTTADIANNFGEKEIEISTFENDSVGETVKEGQYVKYILKDGSEINCGVLYTADSEYGLQLVTINTYGGSSYNGTANIGVYNNFINDVNNGCNNYNNPLLSSRARSFGSNPANPDDQGTLQNCAGVMAYADNHYLIDVEASQKLGLFDPGDGKSYHFGSRELYKPGKPWNCSHRLYYAPEKRVGREGVTQISEKGVVSASGGQGNFYTFRPVFIMNPDIEILDGDGSVSSPYRLKI